jgi:hypothetical protein
MAQKLEAGTVNSYPTPATSKITESGVFSIKTPFKKPIIINLKAIGLCQKVADPANFAIVSILDATKQNCHELELWANSLGLRQETIEKECKHGFLDQKKNR